MLKAKLSSKGRITIPKAVREKLDLREGTRVSILVQGQNVILRKIVPRHWRRWAGRFPNSGMLEALQREHRDEVLRGVQASCVRDEEAGLPEVGAPNT